MNGLGGSKQQLLSRSLTAVKQGNMIVDFLDLGVNGF